MQASIINLPGKTDDSSLVEASVAQRGIDNPVVTRVVTPYFTYFTLRLLIASGTH